MSNISLYALGEEYVNLYNALENSVDEDGVVDSDIFHAVEEAKGAFTEKAVAVATVYRALEKDVQDIDVEIERLAALKKQRQNEQKRVKNYLSAACERAGIQSVKGMYANISFRKSEETVIDNEEILPDEYKKTKITVTADKTAIKAAIKAGKTVAGAHIEEKRNLTIK